MNAAWLATAAGIALALSSACQSRPEACWAPRDCGEGYECLAHVCTVYGGEPVASDTQRRAMAPNQLQVHPLRHAALPTEVILGGNATRAQSLYLHFQLPRLEAEQLARAFVILAPDELSTPASPPIELRARPLLEGLPSRPTPSQSRPRAALDTIHARVAGVSSARFDVTDWVRRWLQRPDLNHGLVVEGPDDGAGYTAALDRATAPRLEIYWRNLDSEARSGETLK